MTEKEKEIKASVVIDEATECWNWAKWKDKKGYGGIRFKQEGKDKILFAHREAWRLRFGAIPPNLCVCHKCDNPGRVNPDHLFVGTQKDNMRDMAEKKRKSPLAVPPKLKGEKHSQAKLTKAQVDEIRSKYTGRRGEIVRISRQYGMSRMAITKIVKNKTWTNQDQAGVTAAVVQ